MSEKHLKHLYFELFEFLSDYGIGIEADISNTVLSSYFLNTKQVDIRVCNSRINDIVRVLEIIKTNGHINYSNNPQKNDLTEIRHKEGNYSVSLTQQGLDYYYSHLLRQATLKSFKNQKLFNIITWTIAVISIAFSIYVAVQNNDLSNRVTQLEQEKRQPKSPQHSQVAIHKTGDTALKKK